MIVPMKHLSLVCLLTDGEDALKALRDLGCVHVEQGETISDRRRNAIGAYEDSRSALRILSSLDRDGPARSVKVPEIAGAGLLDSEAPTFDAGNPVGSVLALDEERLRMGAIASRLAEMEELYSIFGDLNPESISALASEGLNVVLLRVSQSMRSRIDELFEDVRNQDPSALVRVCGLAGKSVLCAVVSRLADVSARAMQNGIEVIPAPSFSVSQMRNLQDRARGRVQAANAELRKAAQAIRQIETISGELGSMAEFEVVADSLAGDGALSWISGWVPADREDDLRNAAKLHSWGVLLRDPAEGENPPVLLRPPRCFRPVVALFKGLGIAPAYREADISVPFFCFFSIFFAMLVGDGAYGMIILGITLAMRKKLQQLAPKGWFVLLMCFSLATIGWGVLSNTWFGCSPAILSSPVSEWLADPTYGNMMLLCFTLGLLHLGIARIWNFICLFPDSLAIAELGWAGTLVAMYCIICNIVGVFPTLPSWVVPLLAVSSLLLFVFSVKPKDLKKEGITLGMLPLNIVGTLGDIISYVRLFAVGLASVKVAQNFNDMALQLALPVWLKILPMVLIMLIGHGLNLLMAGLSVLVHAVRLNTLEFSNHKGISWSGSEFRPFRKAP